MNKGFRYEGYGNLNRLFSKENKICDLQQQIVLQDIKYKLKLIIAELLKQKQSFEKLFEKQINRLRYNYQLQLIQKDGIIEELRKKLHHKSLNQQTKYKQLTIKLNEKHQQNTSLKLILTKKYLKQITLQKKLKEIQQKYKSIQQLNKKLEKQFHLDQTNTRQISPISSFTQFNQINQQMQKEFNIQLIQNAKINVEYQKNKRSNIKKHEVKPKVDRLKNCQQLLKNY